MIPEFTDDGLLPPGRHNAAWGEFESRFGYNSWRRMLLSGLLRALLELKRAGVGLAYLDGSFVTEKAVPGDYDACWDPGGVDPTLLDPVLLDFSNKRVKQKAKYGGELFVSSSVSGPDGRTFLEFFQEDQDGVPKGIVALDLGGL